MKEVLAQIEQWRSCGNAAALCTLVEVRGTAPRQVGACMGVSERGEVVGSITGGCVETDLVERARGVSRGDHAEVATYGIADDAGIAVGLSCGGSVDVLIEPVVAGPVWTAVRELLKHGGRGAAAVATAPKGLCGRRLFVDAEGERVGSIDADVDEAVAADAARRIETATSGIIETDTGGTRVRVFVQAFARPQRLFIIGATHAAVPLCRMAVLLGFHVTVIDPRAPLANADRLPDAHEVVQAWPDEALARIDLGPDCYVVALAHDPKFDTPTLARALRAGVRYVGAIGSRRTHERRKTRLREQGFSDAELALIRSPVGLDLGGRTPEEIALAVLAEMVAARYGRDAAPLSVKSTPIHDRHD